MGFAGWMPNPDPSAADIQRKLLVIEDRPDASIMQYFAEASEWIKEALSLTTTPTRQPQVLVHCVRGVSRSAAIVLAYVIRDHMVHDETVCERAFEFLRKASDCRAKRGIRKAAPRVGRLRVRFLDTRRSRCGGDGETAL